MTTTLEQAPLLTHEVSDTDGEQRVAHSADELYKRINTLAHQDAAEGEVHPPTWIDTPLGGQVFDLMMKPSVTEYEQEFLDRTTSQVAGEGEAIAADELQSLLETSSGAAFLAAARQADPTLNELVTTEDIAALEAARVEFFGQPDETATEGNTPEGTVESDTEDLESAEAPETIDDEQPVVIAPIGKPKPYKFKSQQTTPSVATSTPTPTPAATSTAVTTSAPAATTGGSGTGTIPPGNTNVPPAAGGDGPNGNGPNDFGGNGPTPPDNGGANRQPAPDSHHNRQLSLEAAQARYEATMQDVVISGARRGNMLFNKGEHDEASVELHGRLDEAISELMAVEHPEYFSDQTLEAHERGALINAFYVGKRAELAKQTSEMMADGSLSKFNKFVVKHKVAIGIGATVFGGVLGGGIGGAILGKAVSSGITKMAKKSEANREAIAGATINSGESLRLIDEYVMQQHAAGESVDQAMIARLAGMNMMEQYETSVVKARRKGIVGSIATGAAWGGLVWAGGHILAGGADYAWNGSGGVMDKLNHLDNANGVTPWTPSATKPWWMNGVTPWVLAGGAAGVAFTAKLRSDVTK
ncbi:MAG: hypothetical protein WAS27_01310 [Candidatus Saccharimonadales bacterium]